MDEINPKIKYGGENVKKIYDGVIEFLFIDGWIFNIILFVMVVAGIGFCFAGADNIIK